MPIALRRAGRQPHRRSGPQLQLQALRRPIQLQSRRAFARQSSPLKVALQPRPKLLSLPNRRLQQRSGLQPQAPVPLTAKEREHVDFVVAEMTRAAQSQIAADVARAEREHLQAERELAEQRRREMVARYVHRDVPTAAPAGPAAR